MFCTRDRTDFGQIVRERILVVWFHSAERVVLLNILGIDTLIRGGTMSALSSEAATSVHSEFAVRLDENIHRVAQGYAQVLQGAKVDASGPRTHEGLQLKTHAANLAGGVESLYGMSQELKVSFLLHNFSSINDKNEEERVKAKAAADAANDKLRRLRAKVRSAITEIDDRLLGQQ